MADEGLKSRGVPERLLTERQATPGRAIPPADEPVIAQMERAAQDGTTAGAMEEPIRNQPGGRPGNIPADVRDALIPPPGPGEGGNYQVP
jgi:hypothetical protein